MVSQLLPCRAFSIATNFGQWWLCADSFPARSVCRVGGSNYVNHGPITSGLGIAHSESVHPEVCVFRRYSPVRSVVCLRSELPAVGSHLPNNVTDCCLLCALRLLQHPAQKQHSQHPLPCVLVLFSLQGRHGQFGGDLGRVQQRRADAQRSVVSERAPAARMPQSLTEVYARALQGVRHDSVDLRLGRRCALSSISPLFQARRVSFEEAATQPV